MRILLAEDERDLSRVLVAAMQLQGYEVDAVEDGEAAVLAAHTHAYDAIILDIMMPKLDGLTALSEIRAAGNVTPVLMLTAKAELTDRVAGLDAGADDYLTKPFAIREMLARLRAIIRRSSGYTPSKLNLGDLILNVDTQELSRINAVRLSRKETKLMELFLLNCGKMLSGTEILRCLWSEEGETDEAVPFMYVCYLRDKIRAVGGGALIEGEPGGPYRLLAEEDV